MKCLAAPQLPQLGCSNPRRWRLIRCHYEERAG